MKHSISLSPVQTQSRANTPRDPDRPLRPEPWRSQLAEDGREQPARPLRVVQRHGPLELSRRLRLWPHRHAAHVGHAGESVHARHVPAAADAGSAGGRHLVRVCE